MDELVSIVIPVYNVKEYLEKCIESIIYQTYQNIEIILVDDGSTDGSSELCDNLQKQDGRISVIHKKNGGLVSARKAGIVRAKGRYLLNVDSDDWIESNMVFEMLKLAVENDADLVTSGCFKDYSNSSLTLADSIDEGLYYSEKEKDHLYSNMMANGSVEKKGVLPNLCCKFMKTSLVKQVYLELSDEINQSEDAATTYACCVLAKKIFITHQVYYHYVMRDESITHSNDSYYFSNINRVYLYLKENFERSVYSSKLLKQLSVYFTSCILMGLSYNFDENQKDSIPYYDFPKENIPFNTRIVLYGAGKVGQSYYKQICAEKLYQLKGWVDVEYQRYRKQGLDVRPVEELNTLDYDYVLIALKYPELVKQVKKNLKDSFNIDEENILWFEPISIVDKYCIRDY